MELIWQESFRVRTYEVAPSGHVSVQSLCNYMQEAAANHAEQLHFGKHDLEPLGMAWVLSRLHVQTHIFPVWQDVVRVETWPSGREGLYAMRDFLLYDGSDQVFARATSSWLLLDVVRRRPARLPAYIEEVPLPDRPLALSHDFRKLHAPLRADHARMFNVRYSDLDMNAHVNNVRYVEWAVESLPPEAVQGYGLVALELHFRAETGHGEQVTVEAECREVTGGMTCLHRLVRVGDRREVALAVTQWKRRP
jgi:acyl-ACP thioesterase